MQCSAVKCRLKDSLKEKTWRSKFNQVRVSEKVQILVVNSCVSIDKGNLESLPTSTPTGSTEMSAILTSGAHHELWHFPPLFTIQKHVDVRARQMDVWQTIILNYHRKEKQSVLEVSNAPYFRNDAISRTCQHSSLFFLSPFLLVARECCDF